MKKFLFMLFAVILSAMTVVSCSKDDSDEIDDAIVGTWKLTEVKMSEIGSYMSWPFKTTYASFKSDGSYYGSGYFGTGDGTWSKKGKTVNTYVGGKLYASYEVITVTATDAELKMTMDDSSIWIKCKKQ